MKKIILCFLLALCQYAPSKAQQVDTLEAPHESGLITGKIVKGLHERNIATRILYKDSKVMPSAVPNDDCQLTSVWVTPQSVMKLPVLGDGYTSPQLSTHVANATAVADKFFQAYPLSIYKNYFEVIAVSCPSAESGAKHPNTSSDCYTANPLVPVSNPNNRYGATFDYGGTHRLLYCPNTSQIATDLQRVPGYTKALIIVNTPYYGGSGGNYSIGSNHPSAGEIIIHEFGHSFAGLADEYGGSYCNGLEKVNVTKTLPPKWGADAGVPVPTPANTNCGKKGAYNGANYCTNGWYRPSCDCKMRTLGQPLCKVCADEFIRIIKTKIPADTVITPQPVKPIVLINGSNNYTVSIQQGSNVTLQASGATTYLWSTGATTSSILQQPAATTSYSVVGTKDGLKDTAFATVQVTPVDPTCAVSVTCEVRKTVVTPYLKITITKDANQVSQKLTYKIDRSENSGAWYTIQTKTLSAGVASDVVKHGAKKGYKYDYKVTCVETGCVKTFSVTVP